MGRLTFQTTFWPLGKHHTFGLCSIQCIISHSCKDFCRLRARLRRRACELLFRPREARVLPGSWTEHISVTALDQEAVSTARLTDQQLHLTCLMLVAHEAGTLHAIPRRRPVCLPLAICPTVHLWCEQFCCLQCVTLRGIDLHGTVYRGVSSSSHGLLQMRVDSCEEYKPIRGFHHVS